MNTKNTVASPSHPVWFPDWAEGLSRSGLPVSVRQQYRNAIVEFLRFCKQTRQRATVASARQFMQEREAQRRLGAADLAAWKEGVNWFFREAGKSGGVHSGAVLRGLPTLGAADLGRSEWERRLIRELRSRHYSWRTEQTYRLWAERFVRWLETGGRRWDQAAEVEIRGFLSELATRQRVSGSTQRQALNALVFLVREALGRTLETFGDFTRPRPGRRVPVVLTAVGAEALHLPLAPDGPGDPVRVPPFVSGVDLGENLLAALDLLGSLLHVGFVRSGRILCQNCVSIARTLNFLRKSGAHSRT